MDPVLYSQAQKLKDNEISNSLLEEDQRGVKKYKIIKVSNRFDEHIANYSQDYIKIKELALKEKQLDKIQSWMIEKIDETYININKDNKDCNFTNKWVKK
jgi:peptidyl-prolyl cis-trans isomerase SurA